jgi:hypothetical protein
MPDISTVAQFPTASCVVFCATGAKHLARRAAWGASDTEMVKGSAKAAAWN